MPRQRSQRRKKHRVTFTTADREVGQAPMKFIVRRENRLIGTMYVRRGGIGWFPRRARRGYDFTWEALARHLAKL